MKEKDKYEQLKFELLQQVANYRKYAETNQDRASKAAAKKDLVRLEKHSAKVDVYNNCAEFLELKIQEIEEKYG